MKKKSMLVVGLLVISLLLVGSMPVLGYSNSRLDEFTDYSLDNWKGLTDSDVSYRNDTYISSNESLQIDYYSSTELNTFYPLEGWLNGTVQVWFNPTSEINAADLGILSRFNQPAEGDFERIQFNFSTITNKAYLVIKNGTSTHEVANITGVSFATNTWYKMTLSVSGPLNGPLEINATLQDSSDTYGDGLNIVTRYLNHTESDQIPYNGSDGDWGMMHKGSAIIVDDYGDPESSGGATVTDTDPSHGSLVSETDENKCIWVNFSEPVNNSTVVADETVLLENYTGDLYLTWFNDNETLRICHDGLSCGTRYTLNITYYDLSDNLGYYEMWFDTWACGDDSGDDSDSDNHPPASFPSEDSYPDGDSADDDDGISIWFIVLPLVAVIFIYMMIKRRKRGIKLG